MDENSTSALEFPCEFPIKIIGLISSNLEEKVLPVLSKHVPNATNGGLQSTSQRKGKYISLTYIFTATSKKQLDDLYIELTSMKEVLMVL